MKTERLKKIICLLLLSTTVLGSCSLRPAPAETADGEVLFRLGFSGTPDSLNPYAACDSEAEAVLGLVYDTLFAMDPDTGACEESLCAAYTVTDSAAGGRLWSVTLREGVQWHDGEAMTASDVEFTLQSAKDLSTLFSYPACEYLDTTGISVEDDTHLSFIAWGEDAYVRECLARIPILPRHIWNESESMGYDISGVPADPQRAREDVCAMAVNSRTMVGTGPYVWEEYENGVCTLLRNESYWNGAVGPGAVAFHFGLPDTAEALAAGETDACWDMSLNAWQKLAEEKAQHVTVGTGGELYLLTFRFGGESSPVQQVQVRRALDCCISRENILLRAFGGGYAARGLLSPFNPLDYSDALRSDRPWDAAAAAGLLEGIGYRDTDGDGFRETLEGTPLDLTLLYSSASDAWDQAARILQSAFADAGVRITLRSLPGEELYNALAAGEYDLYLSARQTWPEPFFTLGLFFWNGGDNAYAASDARGRYTSRGWNDSGYANEEFDARYEALLSAGEAERADLTRRAGELLYDDAAALPLGFSVEYQAYSYIWSGAKPVSGSGLYFTSRTLASQLGRMTASGKK